MSKTEFEQEVPKIKTQLLTIEKLQWVVIAGIIGLLLKAYILEQ